MVACLPLRVAGRNTGNREAGRKFEGGTVKLRGNVHGWNERRIAENAACAAPGVTKVEDNIVLA